MDRVGRVIVLTVVAFLSAAAPGAEGEPMDVPSLKVSIAVPEHRGARSIVLDGPASHFHVVVRNVSTRPVTIWRRWCSFGYENLSFEYSTRDGKKGVAQVKRRISLQNVPDPLTLAPDEEKVIDVYFGTDEWQGFPLPAAGAVATVSLQAVFQITAGAATRKEGVWTGRITSPLRDYTFEVRKK